MKEVKELKSKVILVVPAYNESKRLGDGRYFKDLAKELAIQFCFVNDGSTDSTSSVLQGIAVETNGIYLELEKNKGKSEAIRNGILHVIEKEGVPYIGFLDSDGAFPIESVKTFVESAINILSSDSSVDIVISSRVKLAGREILRSSLRHYISRIIITVIGFFVHDLPYDSQSGLKIFRNDNSVKNAMSSPFKTKWFFDIETLIRTGWLSANRVWEEPVLGWRDVEGSHLSWRKIPTLVKEISQIIKMGRESRGS